MTTETWSFTISSSGTTDTTAPTNPSISFSNTTTSSQLVTVSISATDDTGVTGYYLSESSTTPSTTSSGWTSVTSTKSYNANVSYTLSSGNGSKTVYVWFKDAVGNISATANTSITLNQTDTTAPTNPSISINSGATSTATASVTLTLSATDSVGVTGYYASESPITPSLTATNWTSVISTTSYSAIVSWTLSSSSGTKTVYVRFRDAAGNISASASDSITYSPTTSTWTMLKLPDTGQTTSYTATYGEDHDYTINPPSYTDNGNGTITDNVTGLIWQKEDDNTTRTWSDAGTYCDNLTLGGQSDWRLPSKKELISIVNYGTYNPSINTTYFPNTNLSHWSSTTVANFSSYAWLVSFDVGYVVFSGKSYDIYVRCVRGEGQTTTKSFTDNGNGTVTDNDTGLMWQKEDDDTTRTWESAITYCEGLSLGSYSDWRLPNIKELESITDDTKYNPSIDTTYFPNTKSSSYWSSTTDAIYSSEAWDVGFANGSVGSPNKSVNGYVRCVRGGQ